MLHSSEIVVVIISLLWDCSRSQYAFPGDQALIGQPCSPPFGYQRHLCGQEILLEETFEAAPNYLHGPNSCRVTRISQRNELDYSYQEYCAFVLRQYGYHYQYERLCQAICQPTSVCSNRNRTFEVSSFVCCPGFQVRPAENPSHYEYMFRLYFTRIPTLPVGCPRAVGENILECLQILGLTEFINFASDSQFFPLLLNSSVEFTLFAPSNSSFESMRGRVEMLNSSLGADILVGHHIVNDEVKEADLGFDVRLMTLSDTVLHTTTVVYGDRTLAFNPAYSRKHHPSNLIRYSTIPFVGGTRIINADACITETATLHVVDRFLVPGMETIADILAASPQNFSLFTEALQFTNVDSFLDNEDVSRTVFVPTNEAFSSQIPDVLFQCLMYMRAPLSNLVLYHIARGAEYTSSLSLREFTHTLLPGSVVRVSTSPEGVVTLDNDPPSMIIEPNISASNGVVHVINAVLIPPNMNFGMCDDFVPTTPAPTTPEATTTEATTTPPTTMGTTALPATTMDTTAVPPTARNIDTILDMSRNP